MKSSSLALRFGRISEWLLIRFDRFSESLRCQKFAIEQLRSCFAGGGEDYAQFKSGSAPSPQEPEPQKGAGLRAAPRAAPRAEIVLQQVRVSLVVGVG